MLSLNENRHPNQRSMKGVRRVIRKTAWTLALLSFVMLLIALFWPTFPQQILRAQGMTPGIPVVRYNSESGYGPPGATTTVERLRFMRSDHPIMEGDNFSLRLSAVFYLANTGKCLLELKSDDGSEVRIDSTLVVADPGYHPMRLRQATTHLSKGWHRLDIFYFNGRSDAGFELKWQLPGQALLIPDWTTLFPQQPSAFAHTVFRLSTHLISWKIAAFLASLSILILLVTWKRFTWRSSLPGLAPVGSYVPALLAATLLYGLFWSVHHLPQRRPVPQQFSGHFVQGQLPASEASQKFTTNGQFHSETHSFYRFTDRKAIINGWIYIDTPGDYAFRLQANDNAELVIHKIPQLTFRFDIHFRTPQTGVVHLGKGFHQLTINYETKGAPAYLDLEYKPPGSRLFKSIPDHLIYPRIPSAEEKVAADTFRMKINVFRCLLLGFLTLLMVWLWYRYRHRFWPVLRLTSMLFIVLFLSQANQLHYDHQIGIRWFTNRGATGRILISLIFLLYGTGIFSGVVARLQRWARRHGYITLTMGFVAVIMASVGQYFLTGANPAQPQAGALLYILSGCWLLIWRLRPAPLRYRTATLNSGRSRRILFTICAVIILAMAMIFRFYRLQEMPPGLWWDEAQTGRVVRSILLGEFPPVYDLRINAGSAASYLNAVWCWLLDSTSAWSLRSYTAMIGVFTVGVSWWFFRQLFSPWWSLTGMALVAGLRWLFTINRTAMATIDETILLTFAVLALYLKAIRSRKVRYYIFTGLLLGLAMHLHTGARVLPVIIGADLIVRFWRWPRTLLSASGAHAALMIICAVVVFAPMAKHMIEHSEDYMLRSKETLLSTEYPGWYPTGPYLNNIRYYIGAYTYKGDWHPRHNYASTPQLPPLLAVCAMVGAFLSLGRFRRDRSHRLLLLGFGLITLQGVLTVHGSGPNLNRIAENIPIVMAWTVFGLEFIVRGIKQLFQHRLGTVLSVLMVITVVGVSWGQAAHIYFHQYMPWKALAEVYGFQPEITEMAAITTEILKTEPDTEIWAMFASGDPFHYLAGTDERLHTLNIHTCPTETTAPSTVFLAPAHPGGVTRLIEQRFPYAEKTVIPYALIPDYELVVMYRVTTR